MFCSYSGIYENNLRPQSAAYSTHNFEMAHTRDAAYENGSASFNMRSLLRASLVLSAGYPLILPSAEPASTTAMDRTDEAPGTASFSFSTLILKVFPLTLFRRDPNDGEASLPPDAFQRHTGSRHG